jgi:hypothetical protein
MENKDSIVELDSRGSRTLKAQQQQGANDPWK